ncbi:MAG: glycoside hydrolase family 3 C-terminal domain-containing protein, partial [Alistipes sp.]|nr:glycoside hydrolase family 3 C-terminal domain-containing protein [Alistipes sp.]
VEGAWGTKSVNAMAKHWPGSGTGEAGRDAHYAHGKYSVYPGNNFEEHLLPFTEGALKLGGATERSSSIMVAYNILLGQAPNGERVGAGYSSFVVDSLLRKKYGYEGVVCSDWRVPNPYKSINDNNGKPWGVEHLSVAERYLQMVMAGLDQVGGIVTKQHIEEAYHLGVERYGEKAMRKRYEESARRILVNMFRVGLFDNPYLDTEQSRATVNSKLFAEEGLMAQMRSVVMLKNSNGVLPLRPRTKVYIPSVHTVLSYGLARAIEQQFEMVTNPEVADCALVVINSPKSGKGYSAEDVQSGGNGYLPISLQYGEYKAVSAREESLSGGDPMENFTNRTYRNKSVTAKNAYDVENVVEARKRMGKKPVVVCVTAKNPMVFSEIEPYADAILIGFRVQHEAIMGIAAGVIEPQGLLPLQMPKDMHTVERQKEDVPFDMECYKDADGNIYDFAYGLNWSGVIRDWRTEKYSR